MARILIGCECSGMVRRAFRALGHEAISCDLKRSDDGSPHHYIGSLFDVLTPDYGWDLVIAHPPCTYVCGSGLHWNKRTHGREALTLEAIEFAERIWAFRHEVKCMAIENPVGCLSTRSKLGKARQYIQPYEFGHDASKKTGLWLNGLPELVGTQFVQPRIVLDPSTKRMAQRWGNQTDSGQNKLPPSANRATLRSETYEGIAEAMAVQWSRFIGGV